MNYTNDFVSILINNRERIIDKLEQNYSYDYLLKIFSEINSEKDTTIKILPGDKILYRILTGQFEASRYNKSSIDWIPSEELIDGIISIAENYGISRIEELYTGMGILSALLVNKQNKIIVTAADTFNNCSTCNKLNLFPIAKRNAFDYKYYPHLNEPYPEMIISTYFPDNSFDTGDNFVNEILGLINSQNHKIIMIILPNTFTYFHEVLYYASMSETYDVQTYHIKAVSKYYHVTNLLKKYYKSSMIAHILVRNDISYVNNLNNVNISTYFSSAIVPTKNIDMHCSFKRILQCCYDKLSPKFVKSVHRMFDIIPCGQPNGIKPSESLWSKNRKKFIDLVNYLTFIKKINAPQYIYDTDEFLFWAECVRCGLYFIFDKREDFYNFYIIAKNIENSEIRRNNNFPPWINSIDKIYVYLYLGIISEKNDWRNNLFSFNLEFNKINNQNKFLLEKKIC